MTSPYIRLLKSHLTKRTSLERVEDRNSNPSVSVTYSWVEGQHHNRPLHKLFLTLCLHIMLTACTQEYQKIQSCAADYVEHMDIVDSGNHVIIQSYSHSE